MWRSVVTITHHHITQINATATKEHNITPRKAPQHTNNKKTPKRNRTENNITWQLTTEPSNGDAVNLCSFFYKPPLTHALPHFIFHKCRKGISKKKMFQYYFQVKIDIKSTFFLTDSKVSEFLDIRLHALDSDVAKALLQHTVNQRTELTIQNCTLTAEIASVCLYISTYA